MTSKWHSAELEEMFKANDVLQRRIFTLEAVNLSLQRRLKRKGRIMRYFALANAVVLGLALIAVKVQAEDCPSTAKSCKVLVLTQEEENALTTQGGILATAAQARKLDLEGVVNYFFEKIKNAPAGTVKAEPKVEDKK